VKRLIECSDHACACGDCGQSWSLHDGKVTVTGCVGGSLTAALPDDLCFVKTDEPVEGSGWRAVQGRKELARGGVIWIVDALHPAFRGGTFLTIERGPQWACVILPDGVSMAVREQVQA
jgi:hypothetical protein